MMVFNSTRRALRWLHDFVTIPGGISLSGIVVALIAHGADRSLDGHEAALLPSILIVPVETARAVLTTTATAALSALVMVYSVVLLVYTMAASSIGPRLLQRFRTDRINQIAVGVLGATFLYCLFGLWLIREPSPVYLIPAVALIYAVLSILLLLYFVRSVSGRVTIDQEAAEIARSLDRQIVAALKVSNPIHSDDVVLPEARERPVTATETGYVDTVAGAWLTGPARRADAIVVYAVRPGDYVMAGEVMATVFGDADQALDGDVRDAAPLIVARLPGGDLRFSVNLLVEIALRALSPGVNDTFTAIGCVDRLSSSLSHAREQGLSIGVFTDSDGMARVVVPTVDAEELFSEAFPPLRRAARGNGLMTQAMTRALRRMAQAAPPDERTPYLNELRRLRDDLEECGLPVADAAEAAERIDHALGHVTPSETPPDRDG